MKTRRSESPEASTETHPGHYTTGIKIDVLFLTVYCCAHLCPLPSLSLYHHHTCSLCRSLSLLADIRWPQQKNQMMIKVMVGDGVHVHEHTRERPIPRIEISTPRPRQACVSASPGVAVSSRQGTLHLSRWQGPTPVPRSRECRCC